MELANFTNNSYFAKLRNLDFKNLPGVEAQLKMAPSIRKIDIRTMGAGKSPTPSAVMLLFYPANKGQASLVFIKRADSGGVHSGQVSFPGGRYDPTDPTLEKTALRETFEEIGIPSNEIKILGSLTDLYIPPSYFIVSPFVAVAARQLAFRLDPKEVAGLIEVEVSELFKPQNRAFQKIRLHEGVILETPCFNLNGEVVWGATAMILNEFLEYFMTKEKC